MLTGPEPPDPGVIADVEVDWVAAAASDNESGIVAVHVLTPSGVVRLD